MLVDSQSSDVQVANDVFLEGMYDRAIERAAMNGAPFRYLNLGGNIGAFDLRVFQRLAGRCEQIEGVAVEMNPAAHARLCVNLELNGIYTVEAINAAAWNKTGLTRVRVEDRDTGQRCNDSEADRGCPVPMLPWRELFARALARGPVDLVKIDIEGAEEQVVPEIGAADAARMRSLIIETHGAHVHDLVSKHLKSINLKSEEAEAGEGDTWLTRWTNACPGA
jgi:FkbM family methyltransferase